MIIVLLIFVFVGAALGGLFLIALPWHVLATIGYVRDLTNEECRAIFLLSGWAGVVCIGLMFLILIVLDEWHLSRLNQGTK